PGTAGRVSCACPGPTNVARSTTAIMVCFIVALLPESGSPPSPQPALLFPFTLHLSPFTFHPFAFSPFPFLLFLPVFGQQLHGALDRNPDHASLLIDPAVAMQHSVLRRAQLFEVLRRGNLQARLRGQ